MSTKHKLIKIVSVLILTSVLCLSAQAPPNLDYLTVDDCRNCHGDEDGNTFELHHESEIGSNCTFCHTSYVESWRDCSNCHADFDHHENANGNCSNCHDDKQQQQQKHGAGQR